MSYDIYFFKRDARRTAEEVLESIFEYEDGTTEDAPPLDVELSKRAIADSIIAAGLGFEEFQRDYAEIAKHSGVSEDEARARHSDIELNTPEDSELILQITICDWYGYINRPYWEMTPARQQALTQAWSKLWAIFRQHDLTLYDPQLERELDENSLGEVTGKLSDVFQTVVLPMTQPKRKKPWWKFW